MRAPEWLGAALVVACLPAWAALGEPAAALPDSHAHLQRAAAFTVHSVQAADGSLVREYAGADGVVFAVTWSTRGKPRLDQLLGRHFDGYAQAARQAMQQRAGIRHAAALQQGDLVVESMGHLNAFSGRAWLRSRLPTGVGADAIR